VGGKSEIVCVGRVYADIILAGLDDLPTLGREVYAKDVAVTPGGGAAISAAFLANLGRTVELACALGSDPISSATVQQLRAIGADLNLLERFQGGPQITVALPLNGDRALITNRAGPAVPDGLSAHLRKGNVRHLHIAELATLLEAQWLLSLSRECGITVSLDVAWDQAAFRDPHALEISKSVDILFPNVDEAAALAGVCDSTVEVLLRELAAGGACVALKRGGEGASLFDGHRTIHSNAPDVQVVDTTGAGDAFAAGFIDAWLDDRSPEECLARACACGAFAVKNFGGTLVLPTRQTIVDMEANVRTHVVRSSHPGLMRNEAASS
jgi:sugar/nucleoside kinase (ribokinase family)